MFFTKHNNDRIFQLEEQVKLLGSRNNILLGDHASERIKSLEDKRTLDEQRIRELEKQTEWTASIISKPSPERVHTENVAAYENPIAQKIESLDALCCNIYEVVSDLRKKTVKPKAKKK